LWVTSKDAAIVVCMFMSDKALRQRERQRDTHKKAQLCIQLHDWLTVLWRSKT